MDDNAIKKQTKTKKVPSRKTLKLDKTIQNNHFYILEINQRQNYLMTFIIKKLTRLLGKKS